MFTSATTTIVELKRTGDIYAYQLTDGAEIRTVVLNRTNAPVSYEMTGSDLLTGASGVAGSFTVAPNGTLIVAPQ